MSPKVTRYLTHLLTLVGLSLMLVGGLMWWRQSRLEASLLSQDEHVLLAVTAVPTEVAAPVILPESPDVNEAVLPPVSPTPTMTPRAVTTTHNRVRSTPTPEPTETPAPTPTVDPFPPASTVPSRIIAPAIGLDAQVVEMGWQVKTDGNGNQFSEWVVPVSAAGWHVNSKLPGHNGNTVLSGHHNVDGEVFRYVVDLEPGNEIQLESDGRVYRYQVQEKYIIKEKGEPIEVRRENNKYIEATEDERLTLVTCWPYETNTHRVVVIARPIIEAPAAAMQGELQATE